MTYAEQLAKFVAGCSYDQLSESAREQLRTRVLDAVGCAFGALGAEPVGFLREHTQELGGAEISTLIGGGRTAPDRAAFYNGALVRYLDFNDSYLAPGETCHPSDNLAPVLAASEYAGGSGRDFLIALAVAYQVQCRLSDVAPVRQEGFDHTVQGSYAVAAGVSKALGLDAKRIASAIAISGTAFNALRVTRTGALSHWKGLAYPNTAFGCTHAAFLAMRGITGPLEVFEGNKGFIETIAGPFEIDWTRENLERVNRTILKKYNAEVHSQSAIEGVLELQREHGFKTANIEQIEVDIFDVAYKIIGGGEEGDKRTVRTKEEADHSLPYLIAVAVLDGNVMPEQYEAERIQREDVQRLLRKVKIRPVEEFSRRFPLEMPCRIRVHIAGGQIFEREKRDYEGFLTRPTTWQAAVEKFGRLSESHVTAALRNEIVDAISRLESLQISELTRLLGAVGMDAKHA
ncbi:MAG: MmgE/PrpD family protein [Acidobacteria bacterium]|nr:MmgE/PrpD family protein [Acidobacteriota bacterium]